MTLTEKFAALTPEQTQELNALTTAEEVLDFAKKAGVDLTPEEAAEIAARLPDEELINAAGGNLGVCNRCGKQKWLDVDPRTGKQTIGCGCF